MRLKLKGKELALALVAIAVPIALADLTLKLLQLPRSSARTLLLAGSSLASGPEGYRRYQANRSIETSAVYGSEIAYRFKAQSNNLGLISTPSIAAGAPIDLAIVGDSYGEGQGGFPWLTGLQRSWLTSAGVTSLNYAVGGSGFEDFAVAARAAKQQHKARGLLVLMIEHDAYRPYQRMASNGRCSFYSNGVLDTLLGPLACNLYGVVWHHVPSGLSDAQLIRESLARQHYGVLPAINLLVQTANRRLHRQPSVVPSEASSNLPPLRFGPLPKASLAALQDIRQRYGANNVLLVQLPDQPSTRLGPSETEQRNRFGSEVVKASGLELLDLNRTCPLTSANFHTLDNHPNSSGYQRLAGCLRRNAAINAFVQRFGAKK